MRPSKRRQQGLTRVELLVVLALLTVLTALYLPALSRMGRRSARLGCVNNLKQIGLGMRIFATTSGDRTPMHMWTNHPELAASTDLTRFFYAAIRNELSAPRVLLCPRDQRVVAQGWGSLSASNISYFIGLQADEMHPQRILAGDRNLTADGVALGRGLYPMTTNAIWGWGTNLHGGIGNFCLADGSVQQVMPERLQQQVGCLGKVTNWLAVP